MATVTWVSSTGNVTAGASYSGGSVPVDGDRLLFIDNGAIAPATNMTGLVLIDLASFEVIDFPYAIGSSSTPLQSASLHYNIKGPSTVCIDHQSAATCVAYIASPNRESAFRLHSNSVATALTITAFSGAVIIDGSVGTLRVTNNGNVTRGAVVNFMSGAITTIHQNSGHIDFSGTGTATNYYKMGGSALFYGTSSNVSGTIYHQGGTFDYQSTSATTIGTIYAMGGDVSFENARNTVGITNVYGFSGVKFRRNPRLVTISGVNYILDDQLAFGPVP